MKESTRKKLRELEQLASDGNKNIFRRVTVAAALFADKDFIAEKYKDDSDALEKLGQQYFSMLTGFIGLERLLKILELFPKEEQWEEYHYNLQAMNALYDESRQGEREPGPERKRITKADYEALQEEKVDLEFQLKHSATLLESKEAEFMALRERVRELETLVARLEGQLQVYESRELQPA